MTNAELAILSLVAESQRHGYEIEQTLEMRGMRAWTEIGFSSIYYLLNKLEAAGLIGSHPEPSEGKGPGRRVYKITAAGRKAFHLAVVQALSVPAKCTLPIQLGLANLPALPAAEARQALLHYQDELDERIAGLLATQARQQPLPYFVDAMFEHSLALIRAEREWLAGFLKTLNAQSRKEPPHGRSKD